MRPTIQLRRCAILLGVVWLAGAGCGTASRSARSAHATGRKAILEDDSDEAVEQRIEAHARYGAAIIHDLNDETKEAVEDYYKAALLDPTNQDLVLEVTRRLLQLKETDKAVAILESAVKSPSAGASLYSRLSLAYSLAGQPDPAVRAIRTAIKKDPTYLTAYQQLVQILVQKGDYEEGLKVVRQAAEKAKTDAGSLIELAELCLNIERTQPDQKEKFRSAATDVLRAAENLKPENPLVLQRLADGYVAVGESERAAEIYVGVLERFPHLPGMRERLIDIYLRQQDRQKAADQLETILKENPANLRAHYLLGTLEYDRKEMDQAREHFRQVVLLNPDFEQAYYDLAGTEINLNKPKEALATLEKARSKFQERFVNELYTGLAYSRMKDYGEAVAHFETAEKVARASDTNRLTSTFYFQLGAACERNKQYEEAERYLRKSLELAPEFSEALNYLGYMWADRGENLEEARKLIDQAVRLEPENAAFLDSMGWVLFKLHRYQEALEYMRKAIARIEQPDPVLFDHIGDIYAAMKNPEKAREAWMKSLALEPNESIQSKLGALKPSPKEKL
jgi:tetratricopeptide (TPR) repeat protein